jgi:transposase
MEKYKLFVGIDISKDWIDVAFVNEATSMCQNFSNCKKGYRSMLSWLKTFAKTNQMLLCMEHTGLYGMPLWNYLAEHKICFVVENALQIKHSMGIRRSKTDKADAEMIARYIKLHHSETRLYKVPAKIISRLKVIFSHRQRLLKIKHLLTVANNEISSFISKDVCKEMSSDSEKLLRNIDSRIEKVEGLLVKILFSDDETKRIYQLITSVPGIGVITGTYLIIVTQNFTIIKNSRKLSRYGGMSPEKNDSGKLKRKPKVSRIGNKKLKALLSNCVCANLKYDIETKEYQQRKIAEGKPDGVIINNLKNKILHRVYAVVNRGTPYVNIRKHRAGRKVA